ncbi:hypothetical protein SAMN05421812_12469 [Asanoa hainanensis]|uniref:Uncharacterized protein n=1 Tax=Asanoa hainanensis TaxID=560556 RepID=A0A239PF09_9ACTN|nr:hypothetical protein [Asanoa hainanensis]SNT65620.1 hypothetical protein SAMN05421812_12469 [Asanoa hainanensis]
MRETTPSILTVSQRRFAWLAFLAIAVQAPISAHLLHDDSWLLSILVGMMIGTLILVDDAQRRQPVPDNAE